MESLSGHKLIKGDSAGFQPCQIVYIEYQSSRLYAEVVQVVDIKKVCWVRPLMLLEEQSLRSSSSRPDVIEHVHLHDLRRGSDLLLPSALFQAALDVDIIEWITVLYTDPQSFEETDKAWSVSRIIDQFLQQICYAHPEVFQVKPWTNVRAISF